MSLIEGLTKSNQINQRESAERAIQAHVQLSNDSFTTFVEDITRLFRPGDQGMTEDKKLRYVLQEVKEWFLDCIVPRVLKT